MVKRKKRGPQPGAWQGAAATIGTALLLIGALAAVVQKGAAGPEMITAGLILSCLAAGTAGVIFGPRGEGSAKPRLVVSGAVAAAMLILSQLLCGPEGDRLRGALHSFCLFLPCLISLAAGGKLRRRGSRGRGTKQLGAHRH